jgi:phosphatidylserine/phosphatidylglycerophosphate/cardiolipin synthase-like enzyme
MPDSQRYIMTMPSEIELLANLQLHSKVIQDAVLNAENYVWIATANLKDMHIKKGKGFRPILEAFNHMAEKGVTFRVIHSDMPSRFFQKTLERFPLLTSKAMELQICPRSHWKMVIVDGQFAYMGSANFTGAGLGAKGENKRNLEVGITSMNKYFVIKLQDLFDNFWIGSFCRNCGLRDKCPDPIDED